MIIVRTPLRVSLFGGGTDYPAYYRQHGGASLGFSLNRYSYVSVRKLPRFFGHKHRLVYSKIETVGRAEDLDHPTARAVLLERADEIGDDGLEIHHDGDLPARAGLGSSSAFTVGLLHALDALYRPRPRTNYGLALEAIRIEQELVGEAVGSQDQLLTALGGINRLHFPLIGPPEISRTPATLDRERELLDHLALYFTGTTRIAATVAAAQVLRMKDNLIALGDMKALVDEAAAVLSQDRLPIEQIGRLLHRSWQHKRGLSSLISTVHVDAAYAAARSAGALGGKLTGAGGGGFLLLFTPPAARAQVREVLADMVEVPVGMDQYGSTIIYQNHPLF